MFHSPLHSLRMALLQVSLCCTVLALSTGELLDPSQKDWLIQPFRIQSSFTKVKENLWRLSNGLIHRDFIVSPNFATVDFYSTEADTSLLRAFSPEATVRLLTESGPRSVPVGGVRSDGGRAYLNRSAPVRPVTGPVFRYASHTTTPVSSDIRYTPARGAPSTAVWPPEVNTWRSLSLCRTRRTSCQVSITTWRSTSTTSCMTDCPCSPSG